LRDGGHAISLSDVNAYIIMTANEVLAEVLPQLFPRDWLDPPGIVFTDFPSRICIGYVLRGEAGYSYVVDEEFFGLNVSLDELHAAAVANLARLPSASITIGKVPSGAEGWISATDDNFAAARILVPDVQRQFVDALGEPFLVSLTDRDDCFCWSIAQSPDRQQTHIQEAVERFLREDYNLTPDILQCSRMGFTLHLEQVLP
jgi:hypothetical protein